ncbi:adenosine kinase [Gammaproteobacteria bacterium 53_120_T64]|nr:adenosine kinase [Gammaproteobacteria bacterium 53_120_T64]
MKTLDVYGIGAALVDTEIEISDAELATYGIEKGVMTLVDETRQLELINLLDNHLVMAKRASGGSAANSIMAVASFGGSAYQSCKVAGDDNGRFYLDDLSKAGVSHSGVEHLPEGTTGKCLVLITPDAERTMNTYLGISETLCRKNLNLDAIASAKYIYTEGYLVTSPTGKDAAIECRKQAEEAGTKTAFSLSDPGMVEFFRDGLQEMIGEHVDLLFCNKDEAFSWTGTSSLDDAVEGMKQTASTFAITLGAEGAFVFDGENSHRIAPTAVTAVDTNGAGDMFAGAFLYGITNGMDYRQAGELASIASATVVTQFGPRLAVEQHHSLLAKYRAR